MNKDNFKNVTFYQPNPEDKFKLEDRMVIEDLCEDDDDQKYFVIWNGVRIYDKKVLLDIIEEEQDFKINIFKEEEVLALVLKHKKKQKNLLYRFKKWLSQLFR